VLIDAVKPLCTEDLSLASYIMGHIQQIDGPSVPALPAKTVRHMNQRTGYLDRIPDNHRGGVMHLKDESIRYHRNRLILQASLAVVLVVGVLLGWIYLPRSLESKVDQRIATMLQDKSKEQKSMWSAVKFFQSDQALGIARRKLSIHLLQHKGKDACKLLLALYHTTRGRVGESVRIATKRKGAFSLKALDCPDNVQLKRIELRGANLDGATLKRADFMGSSLQELSLVGANLQGSRLFSANMLKANLSKANLRNANLEGTQLQYSKLNGADLRGAKIQHGAFLGASLKGTLFSSNQVKQLGETGANIQGAACLSSKPGAGFVNGAAEACYKWHLSPGPAAARPPGCPLLLRGPIFAFPVLARPGQCPTDIRNQLDQYTAYCPTGNKVACAIGKKCRNGDAKSCLTLATMYHKGEGVTKKPSVAIILYRRSCIGKEAAACYALGQMYEKGHGTKRNAQKALSLFKQACQANHGTACEQLGRTFEQGIDGKVDITQAQSFYKTACDKQKPFSCYRLGRIYSIGKEVPRNPREAADYYQKACDQNHSYGCFWLGVDQLTRQRSRRAGNKTLQKAMPLLDAQCKNRDAASCAFLGKMYEKGYGTRKRSRKAFALYRKACDGRDAMGCNGVGEGYYFGRGTRKRRRRAARYYREGCRYGSGLACNNIGAMYERGKGLRRSARRAFSFYKQSCKLYYGWGCNDLAELYYTGKGVKRDRDTAKTYYKKACSLGVRDACK
jgi:TPR repeat protein/Tfp pilus assembly protein PilN